MVSNVVLRQFLASLKKFRFLKHGFLEILTPPKFIPYIKECLIT